MGLWIHIVTLALIFWVLYAYLIFPVVVRVLARWRPNRWHRDNEYLPTVTILLPAFNEEAVIERSLRSLLSLDYPADRFTIIVASDGSSDRTNQILTHFAAEHPSVTPLVFPERRGKMMVVNDLAAAATGEILFFADADVQLTANTLRAMVRNFADPSVGVVAGAYAVVSRSPNVIFASEQTLASSDSRLRMDEALLHSTIAMFGGNYSIRRELWKPMPSPFVYDDVYVVLSAIMQGKRVIFEPEAVATDEHQRTLPIEFRRKSRNASFGLATLSYFPEIVSFRKGLVSLMLWSHKILRWLSPWALLALAIAITIGFACGGGTFWTILFALEVIVIAIGLIGSFAYWKKQGLPVFVSVFWFLVMQAAFLFGTLRLLTSSEAQAWVQPPRATT